jgi:DNA-binding transcriptional ArsR family regulator
VKPSLPIVAPAADLCCASLGEPVGLSANEAIEVSWRLRALADPARVSIVATLAAREDHALTTRELAPRLGLTEATVSHHLKQLVQAGILEKHREGARVLYRLNVPAVRAISDVLNVCCACEPGPRN